jgi:hypothetical protein
MRDGLSKMPDSKNVLIQEDPAPQMLMANPPPTNTIV